ncbi:MAG TPA: hypothetical protein VKB58_04490 [Terriglobales bacterium]|nr:hypothetical protein [Terriglobales bacterium]
METSFGLSPAKQSLLICALLAAATVAVYLPVRHHPFLNLDDNQYLTDNINVQGGVSWDTVRWAFTTYYALNWHPLTWLSHALDVQMFGLDPAGHHEVNLFLHVLNVLLLYWVLQRATGFAIRSAMVAALFALHPINVESVAWIAERKNLLSMMFFLLALGAYRWYAARPAAGRYSVVALLFALGLLAKPQVITLPFVLLLWDYWPLERVSAAVGKTPAPMEDAGQGGPRLSFMTLLGEKVPLLMLCVASSILTMKAQAAGDAVASFVKYPLAVRLENALVSYALYLGKLFWPVDLAPMYPHPGNSVKLAQAFAAAILLLVISKFVWDARERRYLLVGWLWFLGTMVPMIGIVQVGHQAMADRYAYLPFVGLFIMICWGVPDVFERKKLPRAGLVAASCGVLVVLAVVAHRQLGYWSDNVRLWARVSQVIGPNLIAEERTGDELMKRGEGEAAMEHFRRAVAIKPSDPGSNFALGIYEQKQGHFSEAIQRYQVVAADAPDPEMRVRALTFMSYAYRELGDTERARESMQAAERLRR